MNSAHGLLRGLARSLTAALAWVDRVGLEMAVVRLCVVLLVVVAGYAFLVTVLGLIARCMSRAGEESRSGHLALALTAGPVRRVTGALIGPGLVASAVLTAPVANATENEPVVPTMERVASEPSADTAEGSGDPAPAPTPTMQAVPDSEELDHTTADPPPGPREPDQVADPESVDEWVIEPGDHLWQVAEETVTELWGSADPADVTSYWLTLIETNRSRLVDPDNPDLVYPGQRFVLPPIGGG